MRRVVVAGRWDGARPLLPTGVALEEISQGVLAGCADAEPVLLPFGAGPTFDEAVAASRSQASFVRVPTDVASTREAGERVAMALGEAATTPLLTADSASWRACSAWPTPR